MRDARLKAFALPLLAFTVLVALGAGSGMLLYARKLGFTAASVQAFYLGSEATFARPRTMAGLLEVAVPHLAGVPIVLFIALHLVGYFGLVRAAALRRITAVAFGSSLCGILSGFGVRFLSPHFAWLKMASFVVFAASLVVVVALLAALFFKPRTQTAEEPSAEPAAV